MYYTRFTIWLQEFVVIKNKINVMDRILTMFFFFYVIIIHILFYRSEQEYEENF